MRYEDVTAMRYSLRLRREVLFLLRYKVSEGPRPGMETRFRVREEEIKDLPELKVAA